jgi:hypothetical protein
MLAKQKDRAKLFAQQIHSTVLFISVFFVALAQAIQILARVNHLSLSKYLLADFLDREKNISDLISAYFYELH